MNDNSPGNIRGCCVTRTASQATVPYHTEAHDNGAVLSLHYGTLENAT